MQVHFRQMFPWALLPYKMKIDSKKDIEKAQIYSQSFRWLRCARTASQCWPWRLSQEIGWVVPCPVDVCMLPIDDIETKYDPDDMDFFSNATGDIEIWQREQNALVIRTNSWIKMYQYRTKSGWNPMFLPNGQNSIEWQMGWGADISEDTFIMIQPLNNRCDIEILPGILDRNSVHRLGESTGISLAVRPLCKVNLQRGEPIARLILLHADSLKAKATFETLDCTADVTGKKC